MIDKMMNCTAAESQDSTGAIYGDYMDDMESIVFIEGSDLSGVNLIKWRIGVFGASIVV